MKSTAFLVYLILPLTFGDDVDFTDLLNYDHSNKQKYGEKFENQKPELNNGHCKRENLLPYPPKCKICQDEKVFITYFRRFINVLLRLLQENKCYHNTNNIFIGDSQKCKAIISLKAKDIELLSRFISDYDDTEKIKEPKNQLIKIPDVLDVLCGSLSTYKKTEGKEFSLKYKINEIFGIGLQTIIMGCLVFVIILQTTYIIKGSIFRILYVFILVSIIISFPWTWLHLYKMAVVKKQVEMMKYQPTNCANESESQGFIHSVKKWVNSLFFTPTLTKDKCQIYQEAIFVDPFWEITPTYAIAVTLTKFFLEPLHHVGHALKVLYLSLFGGMPHLVVIGILILLSIMFLSILLMVFGYKLRLPYFLATLEPSGPENRLFSRAGFVPEKLMADSTQATIQTENKAAIRQGIESPKELPRHLEKMAALTTTPKSKNGGAHDHFDEWADVADEEIVWSRSHASKKYQSLGTMVKVQRPVREASYIRALGTPPGKYASTLSLTDLKGKGRYRQAVRPFVVCTPPPHVTHQLIGTSKSHRVRRRANPKPSNLGAGDGPFFYETKEVPSSSSSLESIPKSKNFAKSAERGSGD